jgi:hypothetical protein
MAGSGVRSGAFRQINAAGAVHDERRQFAAGLLRNQPDAVRHPLTALRNNDSPRSACLGQFCAGAGSEYGQIEGPGQQRSSLPGSSHFNAIHYAQGQTVRCVEWPVRRHKGLAFSVVFSHATESPYYRSRRLRLSPEWRCGRGLVGTFAVIVAASAQNLLLHLWANKENDWVCKTYHLTTIAKTSSARNISGGTWLWWFEGSPRPESPSIIAPTGPGPQ